MSTFDTLYLIALFDLEPDVDGAAGMVARKAATRATAKAVHNEIARCAVSTVIEGWNEQIGEWSA